METHVPVHVIKGRGASSRMPHRFERDAREPFDDGWDDPDRASHDATRGATEVRFEDCRTALSRNESPDLYFEHGLNPYRGCEHGCIYCFARPTHSHLNLSPGLDFETRLIAKRNIAERLAEELSMRSYQPKPIALGTGTDGYQPVERDLRLTRSVVEVLHAARHPFSIVTKGSGVERDLDLLAPMAAARQCSVVVSLGTLDLPLARALEPRAASPLRRLRTIRTLSEAGISVGVSVAPQIPFIHDDMEQVLEAAREAGAQRAFYTVIRLPWEVAPLFREWLQAHHPQRADRVMARIADMRGGKDYDSRFGTRMLGEGVWADLLRQRFEKTCRRLGYGAQRQELDRSAFRPPGHRRQIGLF